MTGYLRQIGAIVGKDLRMEFRTRDRLAAMGAFAVLAAVLFNYSIDTTTTRPEDVAAGLIWMTLVFGGLYSAWAGRFTSRRRTGRCREC